MRAKTRSGWRWDLRQCKIADGDDLGLTPSLHNKRVEKCRTRPVEVLRRQSWRVAVTSVRAQRAVAGRFGNAFPQVLAFLDKPEDANWDEVTSH